MAKASSARAVERGVRTSSTTGAQVVVTPTMASSQVNGAARPGPTTPRRKPWPEGYDGEPIDRGRRVLSTAKFPCFGPSCASEGKWHGANTWCVPFCDWKMWNGGDKINCWQRMCDACAAAKGCHAPAEVDIAAVGDATAATTGASGCTTVSIGTTSGLTTHPRADQYPKAAFDDEDWDQELENARRQAESASVASRSNETNLSTSPPPPPTQPELKPQREREIAKDLWRQLAPDIFRSDHYGFLHKPKPQGTGGGKAVMVNDKMLKEFRHKYPELPFLHPPPAAAAAKQLLADGGGEWTEGLMQQAKGLFEAQAAGLAICLVMPELTSRDELMKDPRFQVQGQPGACKQICPHCNENTFVLRGELNVNDMSCMRFAYGATHVVLGVCIGLHCCNPHCPAVLDKRTPEQIATLTGIVKDGIFGKAARNNIGAMQQLGVAFWPTDYDTMSTWPAQVHAPLLVSCVLSTARKCVPCLQVLETFKGLVFWKTGGAMADLIRQQVEGCCTMRIADRGRLYESIAKERELHALQAYLRFVDEQRDKFVTATATKRDSLSPSFRTAGFTTHARAPVRPRAARTEPAHPPEFAKFPKWDFSKRSNSAWHPSDRNLRHLLIKYHEMVEPVLHAHLTCRSLGRGASSDATFKLMIRTKGIHGKVPLSAHACPFRAQV